MADTQTAKLGLVKPEVGASGDSWGGKQNAAFDIIDAAISGTPANVASATTTDLSATTVPTLILTGSVTVEGFGNAVAGMIRKIIVQDAPLLKNGANLIVPGDADFQCASDDTFEVICLGSSVWKIFNLTQFIAAPVVVPVPTVFIGALFDFAGATAPSGFLLCFGQNVSRSTYADLFAVIGTVYGSGDGSTTFGIPDFRGRVAAGQDDMGGTSANRLTNPASTIGGIDGDVLGGVGGAETHSNTLAQNGPHTHTGTTGNGSTNHQHQGGAASSEFGTSQTSRQGGADNTGSVGTVEPSGSLHTHSFTTASSGSGTGHNNVQPTIIVNKMIYTGV